MLINDLKRKRKSGVAFSLFIPRLEKRFEVEGDGEANNKSGQCCLDRRGGGTTGRGLGVLPVNIYRRSILLEGRPVHTRKRSEQTFAFLPF